MNRELEAADKTEGESKRPLKQHGLIDDLWEIGLARHVIARSGGDPDGICPIHIDLDEDAGEAYISSFGKPEVVEKLDRALKVGQVKHKMFGIKRYPGDPGFPVEAAQKVMGPHIIRTIKSWRENSRLPLPPLPLEGKAVELEESVEEKLTQFFGLNRNSE